MIDLNKEKLLILDLDETLIYASERQLERVPDFCVGNYHVYMRPQLEGFICFCLENFNLAIWTASTEAYAEVVVENILPGIELDFVWARSKCTPRFDKINYKMNYLKNLKKVKKRGCSQ